MAVKKIALSKKKKVSIGTKKNTIVKGTPLRNNISQQKKYVAALKSLVNQVTKEAENEFIDLFKRREAKEYFAQDASISNSAKTLSDFLIKKFDGIFKRKGKYFAEQMVKGADKTSATNLKESLKKLSGGIAIKTNFLGKELGEITTAIIDENVSLITSIGDEYLSSVKESVMRSITTGNGLKSLIPDLRKFKGISERKAENIALDQTRKTYAHINKSRLQKVGVKKFEWIHSGGGLTQRPLHVSYNGKIFSYDKLPIIDEKTKERGIPGQAINCRCIANPVIEYEDGEET